MGVEWSSDRMTVRPFGSLEIWYCSLGGRTAPCRRVGATAAIRASDVAIAAAQGHEALRTRAADAIRLDYGIRVQGCRSASSTPELKFRRHVRSIDRFGAVLAEARFKG